MTEEHTQNIVFDPGRPTITAVFRVLEVGKSSGESPAQLVADLITAACVIGEVLGVQDVEEYKKMIDTALPVSRQAADRLCGGQ